MTDTSGPCCIPSLDQEAARVTLLWVAASKTTRHGAEKLFAFPAFSNYQSKWALNRGITSFTSKKARTHQNTQSCTSELSNFVSIVKIKINLCIYQHSTFHIHVLRRHSLLLISIRDALINAHNLRSDGEKCIRGVINFKACAAEDSCYYTTMGRRKKRDKTQPQTKGSYCMLRRKVNKKPVSFLNRGCIYCR